MSTKTILLIIFVQFYSCFCFHPVYIVHGVLSENTSMNLMAKRIQQMHPGTLVYISNKYEGWYSLEPMWRQVDKFGEEFLNISATHPDGFHLIGYSQGGLIARGLLERFPNHPVRSFISLSSPQAGQYGTNFLHIFFPDLALQKAYEVFYSVAGQLTSIGNYWNDPHHQELYFKFSAYLPLLNNEVPEKMNVSYKNGLIRLRNMVLIGGPDDGVITPWQSSLFGYYDSNETILEMRKRNVYLDGYLGLDALDKRGRLYTFVVEGVEHHYWKKNFSVIDKYILPFLD